MNELIEKNRKLTEEVQMLKQRLEQESGKVKQWSDKSAEQAQTIEQYRDRLKTSMEQNVEMEKDKIDLLKAKTELL